MAVERNGLTLQDRELADLQIFFYERPKRVRSKKSYKEFASDEENSEVGNASDDAKRRKARASRRKESPSHMAMEKKQKLLAETLRWLGDNYELKESMCLPRCVMYTHYLDFCKKGSLAPSGPATFGKVIRQKFPKLTTRRLGTRGQSKYHYYGIRVKESSQYFHAGYSKQGLTRFSTMKAKAEGQAKKFALNPKVRTLLPEFPNAKRLNLPKGVSQQKVETFIMMYRTHCQRLLDTVISANFDGINNFILHFWQGMPSHMISVLQSSVVVDVIAICDSILYKVLIDVLIPSSIQDLPDSLREEIRDFSSNLHVWLRDSLSDVPSTVRNAKLKVAQRFSSALRRQVSFVHLAQTARSVLLSYDSVSRMISDLRKIDFSLIMNEAVFLLEKKDIPAKTKKFVQEFEGLLSKQAPLEAYTEWLDSVVDRCILKNLEEGNDKMFERRASEFMGMWSFISSKVLEDLTLRSAPSFGVFHLIYTTFQEYILLIIDNQKMLEVDKELQNALQMHLKEGFLDEREERDWSDLRQAENETLEESLVTKQVYEPDNHLPTNKTTGDNNNNNNLDHTNNINKDKRTNKKNKTSKISESTRFHPRSISRTGLIGQHAVVSPIVPRQIPLTCTAAPGMVPVSSTKQMYTQHPLQTSVANVTMTDRSGRNMPQYGYPDEVSRNATQVEMSAFHGQDFINAIDKSMYSSNVNASGAEFLGTPWLQPDSQSLTVLNNVGYTDPIGSTPGGLEMNYHRNADFGFGYSNEIGIGNSAIHPLELQTPVCHRSDISYSQQGKDSDYSNYQNVLSRYNSLYFDSMRGSVPPMTPDIMSYTGMIQSTTTSMDIEGLLAHEAQMSRLGVGAV